MKHCMVVDDSSIVRKVVKRILSGPEMTVSEASAATQALEACRNNMPDIIIVDASLPDMPTIDLIRAIIAIPNAIKPRIVVCMIEFDVGFIMHAKRAGAQGHLLKPFNRSQILERFRAMRLAD